jgi:hypothetical protein
LVRDQERIGGMLPGLMLAGGETGGGGDEEVVDE